MKTSSDLTILTVDRDSISVETAVKYLRNSGKLGQFIGDIIRQYIIEQEVENRTDVNVNPVVTEQAIIDFRLQNKLTDPQKFHAWLEKSGTTYEGFHASITFGFKNSHFFKFKGPTASPFFPIHFDFLSPKK